jgi:hypothetical protein
LGRLKLGVRGICSPAYAKISKRNLQYPSALRRGFFIAVVALFGSIIPIMANYFQSKSIKDILKNIEKEYKNQIKVVEATTIETKLAYNFCIKTKIFLICIQFVSTH